MTIVCCPLMEACCPLVLLLRILQKMSGYIKYPFLTGPQHNGHPNANGALLVIPSRYVDLDEQVRTTDKFHAGVVAKLQRRQGVTMSDLQKYDILSEVDFRDPKSPWYTAPVIVPINRDRYNLIHVGAVRFSKVNNTCVLRWRCIDKAYEQRPTKEHMDEIYKTIRVFGSILLSVPHVALIQRSTNT